MLRIQAPHSTIRHLRWTGLMMSLSFCFPSLAFAAITTDGSVGLATNLAGPSYAISASLGSQVGGNLFHSFSVFNINTGESATFSGPNNVSNIIARVTGGSLSTIDGGLNSTIPLANLILINPSGIVFGPNASLDVGGSFYASTANYVRLADGGKFDATTPANSVLTTAPLAAFGFLGPVAPISVQGANLAVAEGKTLSLIGGDIDVTGSLKALGGTVNMASVASAGEVGLASGLDVSGFASLGAISLDAPIDVSAGVISGTGTTEQAGSIYIQGGQITTGAAASLTAKTSNLAGGNIDIRASDTLTMNQGLVSTTTKGGGHGGSIILDAGSMTLDGAAVYADTYGGAGDAGNVIITADQLKILNDSWISSDALTDLAGNGTGDGGRIKVNVTGDMTVASNGWITTNAEGVGNGGYIDITVDKLILASGGRIDGNTSSANRNGWGGTVTINATTSVALSGGAKISSDTSGDASADVITISTPELNIDGGSISTTASGWGNGGWIDLGVDKLILANGGKINGSTSGTNPDGLGGAININATTSVALSGGAQISSDTSGAASADNIEIRTPELNIDGGAISSTSSDWGNGGTIDIGVDKLILANGGMIDTTTSSIYIDQLGGDIKINATSAVLSGGAKIAADSTGAANAGWIYITAPELNIDGGVISSTSSGLGDGGYMYITVDKLNLANSGKIDTTSSSSNSQGWGGDINIKATTSVALNSGAQITADTIGDANAGWIFIDAPDLTIDNGKISSTAGEYQWPDSGLGKGGVIDIKVDTLTLSNSGSIDIGAFDKGDGGAVKINATRSVDISSGATIFSDSWFQGNGGYIDIRAGQVTLSDSATINANSYDQGLGGDININATTSVALSGGAEITSSTLGDANAGWIFIEAPELTIDNGKISSTAGEYQLPDFGVGKGGVIDIKVDTLTLSNSGSIDIGAFDKGNGGAVKINATRSVNISSGATIFSDSWFQGNGGYIDIRAGQVTLSDSAIDASSFGSGAGGDIAIIATDSVSLSGGAQIASKSERDGTAGQIKIDAGRTFTSENSSVTTEAKRSDGGNISLVATGLIYLNYGDISTSVGSGAGNGGNIFIDPQFVVLNNSNIAANAFGGNGGNINLIANNFFPSANSTITASSQRGVPGAVALNAQLTDLSGSLADLPMVYLDATGLIKQRCAAQLEGKISTFVTSGRGGIPHEPGNLMPSASLLANVSGPQAEAGGMQYASLSGCAN